MIDKLTCFSSCCCESHSEYNVVQSALKHDQEVLTSSAFLRCLVEQVTELSLAESVSESYLLLLGQLDTVFALLAASYSAMSFGFLIYTRYCGSIPRALALFSTGPLSLDIYYAPPSRLDSSLLRRVSNHLEESV